MARETLGIVITSTGAVKATNRINALGAAGHRAASSADSLNKALKTIGGLAVLRILGRTADSYRNIANRISTVTDTHAEAAAVMDRVFRIANETRQSFEATGIVYARVANAATDLGKSHEEVLSLVEGLNKAMAIGGTTSREANAALIQFSQGLASGTLRGDELRSVLEQSVIVSEVLSRGLGVTRGELKKMGEQGKITSELIFKSFDKMKDELDERFAELIPTLSQSFEIFRNNFIKFIGELNESAAVTQTLGKALVFLGDNLDTVARLLGVIASRIILGRLIKGFQKLSIIMLGFMRALSANPLMVMLRVIALVIGGLIGFSKQISISSDGVVKLSHFLVALWEKLQAGFTWVVGAAKRAGRFVADAFETMGIDIEVSFIGVLRALARGVDGIVTFFTVGVRQIFSLFKTTFHNIMVAAKKFWAEFKRIIRLPGDAVKVAQLSLERIAAGKLVESKRKELERDLARIGPITESETTHRKVLEMDLRELTEKEEELKTRLRDFGVGVAESIGEGYRSYSEELGKIAQDAEVIGWAERQILQMSARSRELASKKAKEAVDLTKKGAAKAGKPTDDGKALKDLLKDLRQLENSLMPILAAVREYAEAEELLTRAMNKGLISKEHKAKLLGLLGEKLEDAIHPLTAYHKALDDEIRILAMGAEERKAYTEWQAIEEDLRSKGIVLHNAEAAAIKSKLKLKKDLIKFDEKFAAQREAEKEMFRTIRGPAEEYEKNLRTLNALKQQGTINAVEYTRALQGLRMVLLDTKLDEASGFERAVIRIRQDLTDVASVMEQTIMNSFQNVETLMVDSITGFTDGWDEGLENMKDSFKSFVDSVLADLTRLMLRQALMAWLGAPVSPAAGGGMPQAWLTGGEFGTFNPLGFQHGGAFRVGGQGGPDSQLVSFMATPGERVTVQTPQQQRAAEPPNVNVRVVNQVDPHETIEVMNSTAGERVVLNVIQRNSAAVRRLVS